MDLVIKRNDGKVPGPSLKMGGLKLAVKAEKFVPDSRYILVPDNMIDQFVEALCFSDITACDTETTGLSWQTSHIIGISWAVPEGNEKMETLFPGARAFYFNDPSKFHMFKPYFKNRKPKVFHNAKFDLHMLLNEGDLITIEDIENTRIIDTMLMSYLFNENESHALKQLSKKYIDPEADRLEKLLKEFMKANNCTSYEQVPLDLLTDYAAADTYYTLAMYDFLLPKLQEEKMLEIVADLFDSKGSLLDIEELLMKELLYQERYGVQLDRPFIQEYVDELEAQLPALEQTILDMAGTINVKSTDELAVKLIDLGVHPSKFDLTPKDKKYKVDVNALEFFLELYSKNEELCKFIHTVKSLKDAEKQLNTYLKTFLEVADMNDRLHSNFNQHIARTGRLSSSEPNIQNIPKVYKKLRACFSCMKGWNIAYFDFSQIEMRIFADYSKDEIMKAAIWAGRDLHEETGRTIAGIDFDKWGAMREAETPEYKDLRAKGKTVNFGVLFGMGKKKTSDKLKLTVMEPIMERRRNPETGHWEEHQVGEEPNYRAGLSFLNKYYEAFPGVQSLMNQSKQVISARGFIRNRVNRRRRLSSQESYKAVNSLIQGFAADMMKITMIRTGKFLRAGGYRTRLVNNIHDEQWLEMPDDELFLIPIVKKLMETWLSPALSVPIKCDVEISNTNWRNKCHLKNDPRPEVQEMGHQIDAGNY